MGLSRRRSSTLTSLGGSKRPTVYAGGRTQRGVVVMTTNVALTQNEQYELGDAVYNIRELLSEEVWRMTEQYDFERVADVVKAELEKFRKYHSEGVTRILAEKICEYAVFDVRENALWQIDAYEYAFEMSSWTYGLSNSEYSRAIEWTRNGFRVDISSENGTVLRLFATVDGKSVIVREAVVW